MQRTLLVLALAAATGLGLTGCGTDDEASSSPDVVAVDASFYPLQWATERIGGEHVEVSSLTPAGAEPHDLELTPKQVAGLSDAALIVHASGFQPAVDDAVAQVASDTGFDVAPFADLTIAATGEAVDEHAEEEHADEEGDHDHGAMDPHFWLDPVRFEQVARAIGDRLAEVDPDHAAEYAAGTEALVDDLATLDEEFSAGLADCRQTHLVTSHTAFAYLAQRYDLEQVGISGVNPDVEPDAATVKRISDLVEKEGITTIYTETLASPALAETIARETGATTAVLDPVAGLTDTSVGSDYLEIMRSNLGTLREGQQCG